MSTQHLRWRYGERDANIDSASGLGVIYSKKDSSYGAMETARVRSHINSDGILTVDALEDPKADANISLPPTEPNLNIDGASSGLKPVGLP